MKKCATQSLSTVKVCLLALLLCCTGFQGYATAWTTGTAGDIATLANWTNGTTSPTTFTNPGDTWTVTLSMTLASGAVWTLGAASSSPDTLTLATGGTIATGGIPTLPTINDYGVFIMSGGTLNMGGTACSQIINVYGNTYITSGTITTPASVSKFYLNTHGDFTMSGGTANTTGSDAAIVLNTYGNFSMTGGTLGNSAASAYDTVNVFGNFSMSGGTFSNGGAGCYFLSYIYGNFSMTGGIIGPNGAGCYTYTYVYGNFSMSGPSAMTNTGAGCYNTVHLSLLSASGTMLADNTSTATWSGTNVFVDTNCTAQLDGNFSTSTGATITTPYGVTVNGTLICPSAYTVNGTNFFTLNGVATLEVAAATGINGAIVTTGTKTFAATANYVFNGTVAQVTGSYLPTALATPDTITVNNSAGVTLSQATLTTGTLLFTNGILNTGAYTMSVPGAAAAVAGAGATSYVNGTLIKTISGLTSVNYEVGDLDYAPMYLTLSSAGTGGSLGLKTTNGLHPMVATSGLSSANMANHYWTITNYAATGPVTVTPKATYNLSDIIGGSNASFVTQEYTGGAWLGTSIATTNTSSPYTSAPTTGITEASLAGDYIFGNIFCGTLPITGTAITCAGTATMLSDATAGGVWSSSAAAIATVSATGNVSGVAGGTAVITYTKAGCTVTDVFTVNPLPNAGAITVTRSDTIVCLTRPDSLTDPAAGGVWSSFNTAIATVGSSSGVVEGVAAGIDSIFYTVTNSCGSDTAKLRVRVQSLAACREGVNSETEATITELKVFPNPNTGTFTMNLLSAAADEEVHVVIMNITGAKVMEFTTIANKATDIKLDPVAGIYLVSASTEGGKYYAKVIVE